MKIWEDNIFTLKCSRQLKLINIKDIKGISYSFIPSPHFTVKESKLYFSRQNNKKEFVEAKNLKIYIPDPPKIYPIRNPNPSYYSNNI